MRQAPDRLGFVAEPGQRILQIDRVELRLVDGLDRDRALDRGVERAVDGAHPALSEHAVDPVLADFRGDGHQKAGAVFMTGLAAASESVGGINGRTSLNFVPIPTAESTVILPPCSFTIL